MTKLFFTASFPIYLPHFSPNEADKYIFGHITEKIIVFFFFLIQLSKIIIIFVTESEWHEETCHDEDSE